MTTPPLSPSGSPIPARYTSIFERGRLKGTPVRHGAFVQDGHTVRLHPAVFTLDDVVAIPQDWCFLTSDGSLVLDGTAINPFLIRKGRIPAITPAGPDGCTVSIAMTEVIDESVLFIGGDCLKNYYHWMVDFLPRLVMFKRNRALFAEWGVHRIAMIRDLPGYAREMLAGLGIRDKDILWIDHRRGWRFRSLHLYSNMSQYGHLHPYTRDLLRRLLRPGNPPLGTRRLYVSRQDAKVRRVSNEDEVFARLEQRGFEKIVPSTLSLADQKRLFTSAGIIVGSHGAGLTNILFASAGAALIELRSDADSLGHFRVLAESLNQPYQCLAAPSGDTDRPGNHNSDFHIDPDRVDDAVAQALSPSL